MNDDVKFNLPLGKTPLGGNELVTAIQDGQAVLVPVNAFAGPQGPAGTSSITNVYHHEWTQHDVPVNAGAVYTAQQNEQVNISFRANSSVKSTDGGTLTMAYSLLRGSTTLSASSSVLILATNWLGDSPAHGYAMLAGDEVHLAVTRDTGTSGDYIVIADLNLMQ